MKFTVLKRFSSGSYCAACPVMINNGYLVKDRETGGVAVRLKLMNVSEDKVEAVIVALKLCDVLGDELGYIKKSYLDLYAATGEEFGGKEMISLPYAEARNVQVRVVAVVFEDGRQWRSGEAEQWQAVPAPKPLVDKLGYELSAVYKTMTTPMADYVPVRYKEFWRCTCGKLNLWSSGGRCSYCGCVGADVLRLADVEKLRLYAEKQEFSIPSLTAEPPVQESVEEEVFEEREEETLCQSEPVVLKKKNKGLLWLLAFLLLLVLAAAFVLLGYKLGWNLPSIGGGESETVYVIQAGSDVLVPKSDFDFVGKILDMLK